MTAYDTIPPVTKPGPFSRAESWLDEKGKGAWIAATVIGFILFWPVGLALVAYMVWSKRMFSKSRNPQGGFCCSAMNSVRPTGNSAFDAYKADTLRRLEDEQRAFEEFLERLRESKDKAEFDQFMDSRAQKRDMDDDAQHGQITI